MHSVQKSDPDRSSANWYHAEARRRGELSASPRLRVRPFPSTECTTGWGMVLSASIRLCPSPESCIHSPSTAPSLSSRLPVPVAKKKPPKRVRKPTPARLRKLLATEFGFWANGVLHVAGIDEVGR